MTEQSHHYLQTTVQCRGSQCTLRIGSTLDQKIDQRKLHAALLGYVSCRNQCQSYVDF